MITKVTHIPIFVHNQDEALNFYTQILGFKVHTDLNNFGMRWLTICPPEQPDFEISLMLAETPEQKALVGKQNAGIPICLATDDCHESYKLLKDRGVEFMIEPREVPWGIEVLFKDLYGNVFDLVEVKM